MREAVGRDEVARWGFDYRISHPAMGIDDTVRDRLFAPLVVPDGDEPFKRHLAYRTPSGR